MKKTVKHLDIAGNNKMGDQVVDLRKNASAKPIAIKKAGPQNKNKKYKPKSIRKPHNDPGKIFLVANENTKFENQVKNVDVNFLRHQQKSKKNYRKEANKKTKQSLNPFFSFRQIASRLYFKHQKVIFSKSLAFFLIVALFSVSTIRVLAFFQDDLISKKDKIINGAEIGYKYMDAGQESILQKDYDLASYKFNVASDRFDAAQSELEVMGKSVIDVIAHVPVGKQVAAADYLLEAGSNMAVAAEYVAYALMPLKQTEGFLSGIAGEEQEVDVNEISFTQALEITNAHLLKAAAKIEAAEENLNKVDAKSLPGDYADKVEAIQGQVPKISFLLEKYLSFSDIVLEILGHKHQKKYLFLFQNNRELRATGGFIGTYGQFDINEGRIENIKIEGPYNVDGQLFDNIAAPEALRLIVQRMYMRDSNWFADFPTSARKVSSYYEKSGQATTDGVIAITSDMFHKLLSIVGPIDMPEYGKVITADNFYEETQRQVEYEYDKEENKPKKFIADMFPKLIDKFSDIDKDKWPDLLNVIISSFEAKDIMMYFKDPELEQVIQDFGWGGEIIDTNKDYLNVVATNIGGGKTDHVMQQETYLSTEIKSDGSVINTVTVSRKHEGNPTAIFEDVKNVSYVRFYVPLGSTLLESEGFDDWFFEVIKDPEEGYQVDQDINQVEKNMTKFKDTETRIFKESGKTVFGNWMGVESGEEKVARIKYKLPFKIKITDQDPVKNYSLVLQKQPGLNNEVFGEIKVPSTWNNIWHYSSSGIAMSEYNFKSNMQKDSVLGLIFADKNFKF